MKQLSDTALRIALIIVRKTYGWIEDPQTGTRKKEDWIAYSQLMEFSGRERAAISKALRELESFNLIDIRDQQGNQLKTLEDRRGKKLMYRFSTSMKSELVNPNQFGKRTSESEHTKETNTKTLSKDSGGVVLKQPSCPLLNGSPLKLKYPLGHKECTDYIISCEKLRSKQFINRAKQYTFLHKIIKAGFDFNEIDKVMKSVDLRYGDNRWDFATLATWLEKGGANARN